MASAKHFLHKIQVASPCKADWSRLTGAEKVRFCHQCKLNVYNLSAMTLDEAEKVVAENEGKLCARIYRRKDGTLLTRDCPVGSTAVRLKAATVGGAITALASAALASLLQSGETHSPTASGAEELGKV